MNLQLHLTDDTQLRAHGCIAEYTLVAEVCWEHPIPGSPPNEGILWGTPEAMRQLAALAVQAAIQAELAGQGGVAAVVVAAASAGVLHRTGLRQAVGGLVQQRAQHLQGAALEAFAADQALVAVGPIDLPAVGREMAEIQPLALGAGGDHQHRLRHVRVAGADGLPGVFQGGDQEAGRLRGRGGVGCLVHQGLAS